MDELADAFEEHRPHLRAVAYRMLGTTGEADDAVQEAWLRLNRVDASAVENLRAWLTTVVARIALNMLRARREVDVHPPEPIVDRADGTDPEHEALLADAVGLALFVVLDALNPDQRLAFVLHDMFDVPFVEIGELLDSTPENARQLASRARRRVRAAETRPDADIEAQREAVEAFLAAARDGDFDGLVAVLHPDVVLRADFGPGHAPEEVHGAAVVASRASAFDGTGLEVRVVRVNGAMGFLSLRDGRPFTLGGVVVQAGRIVSIDILADPERLAAVRF